MCSRTARNVGGVLRISSVLGVGRVPCKWVCVLSIGLETGEGVETVTTCMQPWHYMPTVSARLGLGGVKSEA